MKLFDSISSDLQTWLGEQRIFFIATAPLSAQGHVNVSPKGGDAFRVIGPRQVVYQDYTGSGAETVAHVRENGRIVVMFCAFEGAPKIVRLYGTGRVVTAGEPRYDDLAAQFPRNPGTRAYIDVAVTRIADSCGYAVPFFNFHGERDTLDRWAETKGAAGLETYRMAKNQASIDDLPCFDFPNL